MRFGDTVDHDIHKRAVTHEVGRKFIEIRCEHANMLLDNSARRRVVLLRGVSGGNHVAISQMKPGSSDDDFPGFFRRALILGVLQDADCGFFARRNVSWLSDVYSALSGAANIVTPTKTTCQ